jgi:transposase
VLNQGIKSVIPPKNNRKDQREYDTDIYNLRHLVENAFLHLKRWRGVATRYAKNTASFLAAVQIQCKFSANSLYRLVEQNNLTTLSSALSIIR